MFLEVNPCFQKAHVFCMDLQPAADPYNVVCNIHLPTIREENLVQFANKEVQFSRMTSSLKSGLQKLFSLSGTFKSNGQNFLPNMCAKRTSRARSAKSLRPGSRARLRALE